jgi:hypothetical protein
MMHDQSRDIDRSREVRPESGYTTGVISSDRSHIFRSESGIQPESRLPTGVGHTTEVAYMTGVVMYLHYKLV